MRPDITRLRKFYRGPLGAAVAYGVTRKIYAAWPSLSNLDVVGLGYCLPVFDQLLTSGAELQALMPAAQGVCHWPDKEFGRTALVDELQLPLAADSVDRILVMHGLEFTARPGAYMREIWRVLKPSGRVIFVVPNRRRMWATMDSTPFGHGKPYSKRQLYFLLREQLLPPIGSHTAMMVPPLKALAFQGLFKIGEQALRGVGRNLGGLLMVEAEKQIYGALPTGQALAATVPLISGI